MGEMKTIGDVMAKFVLVEAGLSGSEIVSRLEYGHVVRRSVWVNGIFIRVCNETGIGPDGKIQFNERSSLYTVGTHGYFLHLGWSDQPFREPHVSLYQGHARIAGQAGEGVTSLFARDWEDYGFWDGQKFMRLRDNSKYIVRDHQKEINKLAIKKYKEHNG